VGTQAGVEHDRRYAPRLRCPWCGGLVNLAAGIVDLTTGDRRALCWSCDARVTWSDAAETVATRERTPA